MQQVTNDLLILCLLKDERVFFFPRLTYNLSSSLDYPIVFVSHTNILLGRGGEGTSSYRDCSYAKELSKGKVIL